jgi:uncharacterized Zn-binding protein involved in type VI secretion
MAKQIARTTDPISPHSPCGPGQCGVGSSKVLVENKMVYCVGHSTFPHGVPPFCIPHVTVLTNGSSKVFVEGKQVGRVGDAHACGVIITSGSSKVMLG